MYIYNITYIAAQDNFAFILETKSFIKEAELYTFCECECACRLKLPDLIAIA